MSCAWLPWRYCFVIMKHFHGKVSNTITNTITTTPVHPVLFQAFRLLHIGVCEQLPIPKCKGRGQRPLERGPDAVKDGRLPCVHQPQKASVVIKQDSYTFGLAYQRHGDNLIVSHCRPLALSIAEHPGGAVGAHAVLSGHQHLGHTQTKLLRLLHRHLPVMSSTAYLLIAQNNGPVPETLGVVLNLAGVQTEYAINDTSVLLEEVEAAVSCSLIQLEMKT